MLIFASVTAADTASAALQSAIPATAAASSIAHTWPVPSREVTRPFDRLERNWHRGHRGVDLAAPPHAPVHASADGTVYFAGTINHQLSISILHADGIRTTYGPLSATSLKKGDRVRGGDVIGTLSTPTAQHPEPGLHWGAIRGKTYLNPLDLIVVRPIVLKPVRRS